MQTDTVQTKRILNKQDLTKLIVGDIVEFGVWMEKCLVYNYPNLKKDELFLLSRLEKTGVPGGIGVIFGNYDEFRIREENWLQGVIDINHFRRYKKGYDGNSLDILLKKGKLEEEIREIVFEPLPVTSNRLFHYGMNLIVKKIEDEKDRKYVSENPEMYDLFDKTLKEVGF